MRPPKPHIIVTFHTHTDALACSSACKAQGVPGRIVTVPRDLSAGCGYAWRCDPADRERLEACLANASIDFEAVYERQ